MFARRENKKLIKYFVLTFLAFFLRAYFILSTNEVFNADESLIMLMSKHIAEFRKFPIFHYGNSYLGTLDNYISIVFIKLFGINVFSLRFTSTLLSIIFIFTTMWLTRKISGEKASFIAGLYVAIPPLFLLMWHVRFFIGYVDILILGNIFYILLLKLVLDFKK